MKELLILYGKPVSEEEPAVCEDEKPVVLRARPSTANPMIQSNPGLLLPP